MEYLDGKLICKDAVKVLQMADYKLGLWKYSQPVWKEGLYMAIEKHDTTDYTCPCGVKSTLTIKEAASVF